MGPSWSLEDMGTILSLSGWILHLLNTKLHFCLWADKSIISLHAAKDKNNSFNSKKEEACTGLVTCSKISVGLFLSL